jgi:general secretion pathway protein B
MSYILDALKKAERERGIAQVPTLMTVHDSRAPESRRWWSVSAAAILLAAIVISFSLFLTKKDSGPVRTQSSAEINRQGNSVQAPPPAVTPSPERKAIAPPGAREAAASAPSLPEYPPINPPERRAVPAAGRAGVPRPNRQQADSNLMKESGLQAQPDDFNPEEAEAEDSAKPAVSLREAIAELKMTLLSYSEDRSERLVFINGRKYVEGDYVEGKYLLESINSEGAVLSIQGERTLLRSQ